MNRSRWPREWWCGETLRLVFNICLSSRNVTKLPPLGNLPQVESVLTYLPYPQNGLSCPESYAFHYVVMSHILSSISFCVCVHAHMCVRARTCVLLGCMSYFCCCCCWRSFPDWVLPLQLFTSSDTIFASREFSREPEAWTHAMQPNSDSPFCASEPPVGVSRCEEQHFPCLPRYICFLGLWQQMTTNWVAFENNGRFNFSQSGSLSVITVR